LNKNASSAYVLLSTVNTVTSTLVLLSTVTSTYALLSTVTQLHQHIILLSTFYTVTSTYILSTATPLHKHVSLLSSVTRLNQHISYYQPLHRYINLCPIIDRYIVTSKCSVISRYINLCPIINSYTLTSTCLVINRYRSTYVLSSTVTPLRIISCFKIATVRSCTACVGKLF
jgi:hypothetical protein